MNVKRRLFTIARVSALSLLLATQYMSCRAHMNCADAVDADLGPKAIEVCRTELADSREPGTEIRLAKLLQRDEPERAWMYANDAYLSWAKGDALQIFGLIEYQRGNGEQARSRLEEARRLHEVFHRHAAIARDAEILAAIYGSDHDYTNTFLVVDECRSEAALVGDRELEGYCELSAGKALAEAGYFMAAKDELDHAATLVSSDEELVQLELERASLYQDQAEAPPSGEPPRESIRAQHSLAIAALLRARKHAQNSHLTDWMVTIDLNLAASYARVDKYEKAERSLEETKVLAPGDTETYTRMLIEAAIADNRGDPAKARTLDTEAYDHLGPHFQLQIATREARI